MLVQLALLLLAPPAVPPEVAAFKAAFAQRKGNVPTENVDPAISKCLNMLIEATKRELQGHPERDADEAAQNVSTAMFASVKGLSKEGWPGDEYGSGGVLAYQVGASRMIVAEMGALTRTVAYDASWHRLSMPAEFDWSTPWARIPVLLPSGVVLVWGDSIQAASMRVNLRLVWLKLKGRRFARLGEFEGETTLDYVEPRIKGDLVTAHTIDEPESFNEGAGDAVFGCLTTWDSSSGVPRLKSVQLLHQTLRAIERAVLAAHRTKHPTTLQRRIRKLWLLDGDAKEELGDWTEKRLPGGITRVAWNDDLVIDLKMGQGGYRVVAVRKVK